MNQVIDSFSGEWRPLSNFWYSPVKYEGVVYATNEHAFQAAKTLLLNERIRILGAVSPSEAKRLGRQVTLRDGWEAMKVHVMLDLTRQKYADADLRKLLLATGDASLVEGNTWGDTYWGVCNGVGKNMLGRILMQVRKEIKTNLLPEELL